MHCDEARTMLGAYLDREITDVERRALEAHLTTCAACQAQVDDQIRLSRQVAAVGRQRASKPLAIRLRTALASAARSQASQKAIDASVDMVSQHVTPLQQAPSRVMAQRPLTLAGSSGWMRQAASLAMIAALSSALTFAVTRSVDADAHLQEDVVAAHIRSLLADSPIQVASSDQHTVKPWFTGRIDFAPDVKDLTAEGFPLVGGRLDYLGGRRVGSLVYKRQLHVVNVFMWPAPTGEPFAVRAVAVKGFNAVQWSRNGVVYWAVSDLNAAELRQLQSLL